MLSQTLAPWASSCAGNYYLNLSFKDHKNFYESTSVTPSKTIIGQMSRTVGFFVPFAILAGFVNSTADT